MQTSLAGAMALGLKPGSFYREAYPGSLNLLMTYRDGCRANCGYCGLARERVAPPEEDTFIRVKWPVYELEHIIERLKQPPPEILRKIRHLRRICLSMITHPQAAADALDIVHKLRTDISLPVSVLVSPTVLVDTDGFFRKLQASGVDCVGIAVDAATPELFAALRGPAAGGPHCWQLYWEAVAAASHIFGRDRTSAHFIVGLGESEQEMATAIERARRYGAQAHLFSFCPEPGSRLADHQPPSFGQYRRIQLAAYLFNRQPITINELQFDCRGKITGYGRSLEEWLGTDLDQGKPFMTSGCPDQKGCVACNRPYGNERPGPVLRNYPFEPTVTDIQIIKGQIWNE